MKILGRIIARNNIAGVFIPIKEGVGEGVFEIREVLGEITIVRVGNSAGNPKRRDALDVGELFNQRGTFALTESEMQTVLRNQL